jgi:hypothetical protein
MNGVYPRKKHFLRLVKYPGRYTLRARQITSGQILIKYQVLSRSLQVCKN